VGIVACVLISKGLKFLALEAAKLGKDLPTRLLIVPWGKTETNQGPVICNATTLRELPANQARRKRDRVALDFQHNKVEGSQFYKGEPAKVAAFASLEVIDGEGIYLANIEWTPDGKAFAADGHYPDLSPAIITNDKGEVVVVHSARLGCDGEIDGITLFSTQAIKALWCAPSEPHRKRLGRRDPAKSGNLENAWGSTTTLAEHPSTFPLCSPCPLW
jgi:phage I-like protein